ncbi:hypothetical protein N8D74_10060 [Curtobacterium flaccumfaciens]|uniref:Uncharacterized protein n=1 Tax=Curtobacterium poinsettiae TaxID=159612 RepID=A0A9Q9T4B6_9MICO|nr:hypothetical protein [Curtobacterium flaccumfaciens]UXN23928.1 hypothetical protein N8D74_10060 [Curtobacterium flaccumfaciens]UYC82043.1 hypothetical protein OE229_06145 [Curtobacterium flaccumfaciens pv. poinsettiae]
MFDEREWSQIVDRLIRLTRQQSVAWKTVQTEDGSREWVETRAGDLEFLVGSVDEDRRPPFYLAVWDVEATRYLARVESEPWPDDVGSDASLSAAQKLIELRALAYRSAQGSPQLLARIMENLNEVERDQDLF